MVRTVSPCRRAMLACVWRRSCRRTPRNPASARTVSRRASSPSSASTPLRSTPARPAPSAASSPAACQRTWCSPRPAACSSRSGGWQAPGSRRGISSLPCATGPTPGPLLVLPWNSGDDGWVNLASVGSRILGAAPDLDPRTYGCPNLSTLVTKSGGFEVRKNPGKPVFFRRKTTGRKATARASASA